MRMKPREVGIVQTCQKFMSSKRACAATATSATIVAPTITDKLKTMLMKPTGAL